MVTLFLRRKFVAAPRLRRVLWVEIRRHLSRDTHEGKGLYTPKSVRNTFQSRQTVRILSFIPFRTCPHGSQSYSSGNLPFGSGLPREFQVSFGRDRPLPDLTTVSGYLPFVDGLWEFRLFSPGPTPCGPQHSNPFLLFHLDPRSRGCPPYIILVKSKRLHHIKVNTDVCPLRSIRVSVTLTQLKV